MKLSRRGLFGWLAALTGAAAVSRVAQAEATVEVAATPEGGAVADFRARYGERAAPLEHDYVCDSRFMHLTRDAYANVVAPDPETVARALRADFERTMYGRKPYQSMVSAIDRDAKRVAFERELDAAISRGWSGAAPLNPYALPPEYQALLESPYAGIYEEMQRAYGGIKHGDVVAAPDCTLSVSIAPTRSDEDA